jgi:DNA-binding CsgD family transcriptional regulator
VRLLQSLAAMRRTRTPRAKRPRRPGAARPEHARRPPDPLARFFPENAGQALPPPGAAVYELGGASGDYVLVVAPLPASAALERCTAAEREVLAELVAGASNREIARRRGRSVRTVANQVASLFRRFGVASRRELLAALGSHRR